MLFEEISKEEFKEMQDNFDNSNFYQTVEWSKIKRSNGWDSYFVGVRSGKNLIAVALLLSKNLVFNKKYFYAPRGMLLDYKNKDLLSFFTEELKKFVAKKDGIMLKIDPALIYKVRDKNGNEVKKGEYFGLVSELEELGYEHMGFSVGFAEEIQYRWTHCLNIKRRNDKLYNEMDQRCRRCIRKSKLYPLKIKDVDEKNIDDFKKIMEHTAIRQKHYDRSSDYYLKLKEEFGDRVKLVVVYLIKKKYLKDFSGDKLYERVSEEKRELIPISAGGFIFDNDRLIYVYGGTYSYYMKFMAQYKMQMDMINLAKRNKKIIYDFGGISGDFDKNSKNYGIYEFKRGFGGYVVEYIGEFDLVVDRFMYNYYKGLYKQYRNLKKFKGLFRREKV